MTPNPKLQALLAGALIGDALGAPLNGLKAGHIGQLVPGEWYDDFLEPKDAVLQPDKPNRNCFPGMHSILGTTLLANTGFRTDQSTLQHASCRAAKALVDLSQLPSPTPTHEPLPHLTGVLRRPGKPLKDSLARWGAEYPWEPADHFTNDQTSEGASPCFAALAFLLNPDLGDPDVPVPENDLAPGLLIGRFTHLRESTLVACAVVVEAARLLLACDEPKKLNGKAVAEQLHTYARGMEDRLRDSDLPNRWSELGWGFPVQRFSECLSPIASLLDVEDIGLVEKTLIKQASEFAPDRGVTHVQHGFAPVLIPWVLYKALGTDSHSAAVEDALNRGGETSLAAGLIGALLGARYGTEHIREEWLSGLLIWPQAKAFLENPGENSEQDWITTEQRLTEKEEAFRKPIYERAHKNAPQAMKPKKDKKPVPVADTTRHTEKLPFAPPPEAWLGTDAEAELAPWEKQRLKAERGRKRIDWKEDRRQQQRNLAEKQAEQNSKDDE